MVIFPSFFVNVYQRVTIGRNSDDGMGQSHRSVTWRMAPMALAIPSASWHQTWECVGMASRGRENFPRTKKGQGIYYLHLYTWENMSKAIVKHQCFDGFYHTFYGKLGMVTIPLRTLLKKTAAPSRKHMGVSINGGTPKWMVYNGKSHSNHLGVPLFQETSILGSNR